jgi:hypothetical protein
MGKLDIIDGLIMVGLVMIGAGLGAYDWRLALVVCGFLLLALGVWFGWRAASGPRSDG